MVFLEISQNSQENTARVSFLLTLQANVATLSKKSLAQVFSCEFYEISKNIFLQNTSGGCFFSFTFVELDAVYFERVLKLKTAFPFTVLDLFY